MPRNTIHLLLCVMMGFKIMDDNGDSGANNRMNTDNDHNTKNNK